MDGQRHGRTALSPGMNLAILLQSEWASCPTWRGRTISPVPASEHRTDQHVVSRYTDWAVVVALSHEGKY